ncbi:MAG: putative transporter [Prevotella sp.]|nr:putative transporter [Prevotella sp.]
MVLSDGILAEIFSFSGDTIVRSVVVLSLVVLSGLVLGKIKIGRIPTGLVWVLFVGLLFSYFGLGIDSMLSGFMKEFALILFVYSIGLQVAPGFCASFRKEGLVLTVLASGVVLLSILVALNIYALTDIDAPTLAGILSGAVTNTPGLGAAEQACRSLYGEERPSIVLGYAVAYPAGVAGVIFSFVVLRYVLRVDARREVAVARQESKAHESGGIRPFSVKVTNQQIVGRTLKEVRDIVERDFVVSLLKRKQAVDGVQEKDSQAESAVSFSPNGRTVFCLNDEMLVTAAPNDIEAVTAIFGEALETDWLTCDNSPVSRSILITRPEINGKTIAQLHIRLRFGANVTRVFRSGEELMAMPHLRLQIGDRLTVVGTELAVNHAEKQLGNQMKNLNAPNLIPIFLGIVLGCVLGNIPLYLPGLDHPLKLGMTGGPLIAAILLGCFGPRCRLITYNTVSANMMIREVGICIFLACVGLESGSAFASVALSSEGLRWMGYGLLMTVVPILVGGVVGKLVFGLNLYTVFGTLAGANTNPPALAYARESAPCDASAVAYLDVYPLAMLLRIVSIQVLVLALC